MSGYAIRTVLLPYTNFYISSLFSFKRLPVLHRPAIIRVSAANPPPYILNPVNGLTLNSLFKESKTKIPVNGKLIGHTQRYAEREENI